MSLSTPSPEPRDARALARVTAVRDLSPSLRRITLSAPEVAQFGAYGRDHFVRLLLAPAGRTDPLLPADDDWWAEICALPVAIRPVLRNYTVRRLRREVAELDVDFVLHGDAGPASRWARGAETGSGVGLIDQYAPSAATPDVDAQLLCGDETALPAIGAILESLPPGARADVYVEVPSMADVQELSTEGDVRVRWLTRDGAPHGERLRQAVRRCELPGPRTYAWLAGESATVALLRRHLVNDRGMDRADIYFSGYWRRNRPAYD